MSTVFESDIKEENYNNNLDLPSASLRGEQGTGTDAFLGHRSAPHKSSGGLSVTMIKQRLKKDVASLYTAGIDLLRDEISKHENDGKVKETKKDETLPIQVTYQGWYSKCLPVIKQVLPDRYNEFVAQYKLDKRKDSNIDFLTYTISDYLIGLSVTRGVFKEEVVNPWTAFTTKFQHQLWILQSSLDRIESRLSDIEGVLQAELFDTELSAAGELMKKGHLRAAGALAGVTLEIHLSKVSAAHGVKLIKKSPTISDFNEELRKQSIIDMPVWRHIQRLGDIRNLCVHAKERDPTEDEIKDMIQGAEKIVKTVF